MASEQLINKARAKHNAKMYGEAIKLYQMVLMKNPGDLDANYLLGTVYAETGKLEAAKKYLIKAEKLMPNSPYVKVNLGNIYKEQGYFEDAIISFISALELQYDLFEALNNLGVTIGLMVGKSEKAATCSLKYSLLCIQDNRTEDALVMLKIGNTLDPDNIHIRYLMTILEGNKPDKDLQEEYDRLEDDGSTSGSDA